MPNVSQIEAGNVTYDIADEQARTEIANKKTIVSSVKVNGVTTITLSDNTTITINDGTNGSDGNGIISVVKTSTDGLVDTYTITYTSGDTTTFTVTNGANGTNGTNGSDGNDGVSPTVTIDDTVSGQHTVTITDTNNPSGQSFIVHDGTNGTNGINGTNGSDGADGDSAHIVQLVTYDYSLYSYTLDGTSYTNVPTAPPDGAENVVETQYPAETTLPPAVEAAGTYIKHVRIKTWVGDSDASAVTSDDLYTGVALAQELSNAIQEILDGNVTTTSND